MADTEAGGKASKDASDHAGTDSPNKIVQQKQRKSRKSKSKTESAKMDENGSKPDEKEEEEDSQEEVTDAQESAVLSPDESNGDQPAKPKSKGLSCGICGRVASSSHRLNEHLSRHTGEKNLECRICGKKFAWRYSFRSHMASHSSDNPNKCTICGKKYCNKSAVKNHMLRIHGNPKKDFKCDVCGKGFMTKAELERHGFNHSKEKPFVCEFCGNTYRFKGALSVHYRVHTGEKPYKCEYCNMSFIHMSSAIGHRRRHTGEMPFKCDVCGKMFRVKRAMTAHMSVHSEDRPFKCDECGKTFRSRSGYRVHLDYHLGVKRHTCKHCGRAFRAWCNMHKHMRRHTGERPHVCDVCGKSFIEKQELKNHAKCHSESNQKPRKKKEVTMPAPPTPVDIPEPEVVPPISTHLPPNIYSAPSFDNAQLPDTAMIQTQPQLPETDHESLYDPMASIEKNRVDKCQLLPDNFIPQFFTPQPPAPQYIPQPAPLQGLYTGPQVTHLLANRTPCVPSVNPTNFSCNPVHSHNYGNFPYCVQHSAEPVSKCKLCRSVFQSTLNLKRHLLEYHRIEEESIEELLV